MAARADAVSGAELRDLARAARDDPAALARLRRVDRVDGAPVDVGAALRGARGAQLRARLALLAAAPRRVAPAATRGRRRGTCWPSGASTSRA